MRCIFCGSDTKVTDKRESGRETRRRRECLKCKRRFTTYEKTEFKDIIIVKKDGRREPFSREKIKVGITKACEKRHISSSDIENIITEIEDKLRKKGKETKSDMVGKLIMSKLKRLDKVAYIRFASVYRDFQDVKDFKKEISEL